MGGLVVRCSLCRHAQLKKQPESCVAGVSWDLQRRQVHLQSDCLISDAIHLGKTDDWRKRLCALPPGGVALQPDPFPYLGNAIT